MDDVIDNKNQKTKMERHSEKHFFLRMMMIVSVLLLTVFRMSCASQSKPQAYWLPPAMGATPAAPPLDPKEGVNMVPPNFGTQAESTFFF